MYNEVVWQRGRPVQNIPLIISILLAGCAPAVKKTELSAMAEITDVQRVSPGTVVVAVKVRNDSDSALCLLKWPDSSLAEHRVPNIAFFRARDRELLVDWEADFMPRPTYQRLDAGEVISARFDYHLKDYLGFLIPGPGKYTAPLDEDLFVAQVIQRVIPCGEREKGWKISPEDLKRIEYIKSPPTEAFRF